MTHFIKAFCCWMLFPSFLVAQTHRHTIYFASGQSTLSYQMIEKLEQELVAVQAKMATYTVHLTGHTDHVGDKKSNEILSQKRCEVVRDALLEQQLDADKITYEIYTDEKPAEDNNQAHNRRVEIVFEVLPTQSMEIPTARWSVDPTKGGEFVYERSGSVVRIPPNALLYEDGQPVQGNVEIRYKEFRDPVDFLISDIPMEHEGQQFNSAGMFDIQAKQGDKNIVFDANQMMEIDLVLSADSLDDLSFYTYDSTTRAWTTIDSFDSNKSINEYDIAEDVPSIAGIDSNALILPDGVNDTLEALREAIQLGIDLADSREHLLNWRKSLDIPIEARWRDVKCSSSGLLSSEKWYENISRYYRVHIHHSPVDAVAHKKKKGHKKLKKDVVIWLWDWQTYSDRKKAYRWWYNDYKKKGGKDVDKEASLHQKYVNKVAQNAAKIERLEKKRGPIGVYKELRQAKSDAKIYEGGYMVSQARLKAQQWIVAEKGTYLSQDLYQLLKPVGQKGKWWADYRIEHLGGENFQIVLKGWRDNWDTLQVQPLLSPKQRRNSTAAYQQIIDDCKQLWLEHNRTVEDSIAQQKKAWENFLSFSEVLKSPKQEQMNQEEWLVYCSKYPLVMKGRYRTLERRAKYCRTYREFLYGSYKPYAQTEEGRRIQRKLSFSGELQRLTDDINRKRPQRRVRINRFAIGNIDQLFFIPPPPPVYMVTYKDREGRKIIGKRLAIINYNFNSISYSKPHRLTSVLPSNKAALYLLAKNGRTYILRSDAYDAMESKMRSGMKYAFQMETVSGDLKTADGLRKALDIAQ